MAKKGSYETDKDNGDSTATTSVHDENGNVIDTYVVDIED